MSELLLQIPVDLVLVTPQETPQLQVFHDSQVWKWVSPFRNMTYTKFDDILRR